MKPIMMDKKHNQRYTEKDKRIGVCAHLHCVLTMMDHQVLKASLSIQIYIVVDK